MTSWKTWVYIPSGLIKSEGSPSTFNGSYLVKVENVS